MSSVKDSILPQSIRRTLYLRLNTFIWPTTLLEYFSTLGTYLDLNELYQLIRVRAILKEFPKLEIPEPNRKMRVLYGLSLQQESNLDSSKPDQVVAIGTTMGTGTFIKVLQKELKYILSSEDQAKYLTDRTVPDSRTTHLFFKLRGNQSQFDLLEFLVKLSKAYEKFEFLDKNPARMYYESNLDYSSYEVLPKDLAVEKDPAFLPYNDDYDSDIDGNSTAEEYSSDEEFSSAKETIKQTVPLMKIPIEKLQRTFYVRVNPVSRTKTLLDYFTNMMTTRLDLMELYRLIQAKAFYMLPKADIQEPGRSIKILTKYFIDQEANLDSSKPDQVVLKINNIVTNTKTEVLQKYLEQIFSSEDQNKFLAEREVSNDRIIHIFLELEGTQKQFDLLGTFAKISRSSEKFEFLDQNPVRICMD